MKLSKWKIELVVVIALVLAGLTWLWIAATSDERAASKEVEVMIKFAQRQALEIAIIEQSSKLANYKQQLAAAQQSAARPVKPNPPSFISPVIPDPKDIEE